MEDDRSENGIVEHKAYARVGLLGNPSDVYYGRAISFSLGNFWASVRLEPSTDLVIVPHPTHDLVQFNSLPYLVNRLQTDGYYGGVRLLMAICKIFYNYCKENNISLHDRNFKLSYDTNIPRQTGLSGSSAIVCAALSCLLDFYKVRHLIKLEVRPNLILNAEKELGIVAGLQDRVVQVYGGLVYMDFSKKHMEELGHGLYTPMTVDLLPPLYLIYAENPSDSGKVHSTVRQKWLDGDKFIISSMEEVANIPLEGHTALLEKDYTKLANLMNRNFDLRRQMFGDDALGALNIEMVEVARRVGAASKFTGSGGAVVVFCPDGPSQAKLLEDACEKAGFVFQPAKVMPSFLNEVDIETLSSKLKQTI
ncbi:glucuronokinase 1-like isoform X1 [Olea europaea var. sylvestris]|uniref:glucuronokinase 1-like isoform X1 n=1 Tax=Olea europaea var. sylvestris TaxID=158386 RepID=UPI000C1CEB37|nr:glucuronokinase 1-like isoform X1 [Olea europaea var. sylvestris]